MRIVAALGLLLALLCGCSSTTEGQGSTTSSCRPVFFGVAGSGQGLRNPPPAEVPPGVSAADAHAYGTTVGRLKTELTRIAGGGLAATHAIDYPAIPVSQYVGPAGIIADLALSEGEGVMALLDAVRNSYRGGCAARPVLLAGYSQGAEVVIQAANQLTAAQRAHVAVALFGNPSYLPGVRGDFPSASVAAGVRPSLGEVPFELADDVRDRTIDVCAPLDGVCNVDPDRTTRVGKLAYVLTHVEAHTHAYAFDEGGLTLRAARFLWAHR